MVFVWLVFLMILFVIGVASHFLSTRLHRRLVRAGNRHARGYRIAAFIVSFLVIFVGLAAVFLMNVRIER
jgi:uncharacterized BrkB/YihY/UPF0761 family membrane protein